MKESWLFRGAGVIGLVAMAILLMISPVLANTTTTTTPPTPPTMTTNAATYTQMSSTGNPEITFNGTLTIGSYKSVSVYFEYGLTTAYGYTSAKITKKTSGTFSATAITNLAVGTTYDYRADVKYGSTVVQGSNQTAVVSDGSGGGSTVIYTGITVADGDSLTIDNDVLCIGDINVGSGSTLIINGDCQITGVIWNSTGAISISGNLECPHGINQSDAVLSVWGNLESGTIFQTGATVMHVNGNAYITSISNETGIISIIGDCKINTINLLAGGEFDCSSLECTGTINANHDGVSINIDGKCEIAGALYLGGLVSGSLTVNGYLAVVGVVVVNSGASITYNKYVEYSP